jgi:PBP1b-binding outer membrane lipoprotein LpoB
MIMKRINNKSTNNRDKFKSLVALVLGMSILSGCASGYMTSSSYDPATGKHETKKYTPLFSSDSIQLAENAEFKVSVVITRRVEPISLAGISGRVKF